MLVLNMQSDTHSTQKTKHQRVAECVQIRHNLAKHGFNTEITAVKLFIAAMKRFVDTGESETIVVKVPEYQNHKLQLILSNKRPSGINVLQH